MLTYLQAHPAAFKPDEVQTLTSAFDKAWESIQASGAKFETDAHTETARTAIAKHIIEAARHGERDQRRLRDGAILAYTHATRRNATCPTDGRSH